MIGAAVGTVLIFLLWIWMARGISIGGLFLGACCGIGALKGTARPTMATGVSAALITLVVLAGIHVAILKTAGSGVHQDLANHHFEQQAALAEEAARLHSDHEIKEFMLKLEKLNLGVEREAHQITPRQLQFFKEYELPAYRNLAAANATKQKWGPNPLNDSSTWEQYCQLFGAFGPALMLLSAFMAFKIAAGNLLKDQGSG